MAFLNAMRSGVSGEFVVVVVVIAFMVVFLSLSLWPLWLLHVLAEL